MRAREEGKDGRSGGGAVETCTGGEGEALWPLRGSRLRLRAGVPTTLLDTPDSDAPGAQAERFAGSARRAECVVETPSLLLGHLQTWFLCRFFKGEDTTKHMSTLIVRARSSQ